MESNQFGVMEETCKAEILRPFKVPSGKRAPLTTAWLTAGQRWRAACLQERWRCTESVRSLHNTAQLDTRILCAFGAFAPDGRHWPLLQMGLTRALQQFAPGAVPVSGRAWVVGQRRGSSHAWVVVAEAQELRRAVRTQDFTELRHGDRDRPRSARLSSNNNNKINGNNAVVLIVSFKLYNNHRMYHASGLAWICLVLNPF